MSTGTRPIDDEPLPSAVRRQAKDFGEAVASDVRGFEWGSARTRRAAVVGLACALATLVALLLDLSYPMWGAISAFVVVQADVAATEHRAVLRIAGTLAGAGIAVSAMVLAQGSAFVLLAVLVTGTGVLLYRSYSSTRHAYAWMLAALTLALVLISALADPVGGLRVAAMRTAEIVVGAGGVILTLILLEPPSTAADAARTTAAPTVAAPRAAQRAAGECALGVLVVVLLYDGFDLPGFSSAAVSILRIADPNPRLGRHRGFLRLVGCAVGAATGLALVGLDIDFLPTSLAVVFLGTALFGYFFAGGPESGYAGMQAGLAFLITFVGGGGPTQSLEPGIDRLAGITLAFAVFWAVDVAVNALWHVPEGAE